MKTSKEPIGYRLKDEFEIEEFRELTKCPYFDPKEFESQGTSGCFNNLINHMKKMGVLDLWFEPVYKEEPELEVNKWYKHETDRGCTLVYFQGLNKETYGFAHYGDWIQNARWSFTEHGVFEDNFGKNGELLTPASDAEVEKALIQEATKRGFKKGVKFKELGNNNIRTLHSLDMVFPDMITSSTPMKEWLNKDTHCSNPYIFHNGQWATIIEQPKESVEVIFPKHLEGKLTIKYQ